MSDNIDEFEAIARFFNRNRYHRRDVLLGIGDDCALLQPPAGEQLAISCDTLTEGTHFFSNIDPADLAIKALAVNLSDLAAIGATPAWLTLSLALPRLETQWLTAFSTALLDQLTYHGMVLIGGNTTYSPIISITLTIHGFVPAGAALMRSGAEPGDSIYVSGSVGGSAAGFLLLNQQLKVVDQFILSQLLQRHLHPIPRIGLGISLRNIASAAIDISDGLFADLRHLLRSSDCGALIHLDSVPIASELDTILSSEKALELALFGGEDYELCFTVPLHKEAAWQQLIQNSSLPRCVCIGQVTLPESGIKLFQSGSEISIPEKQGFKHFS